MLKRGDKSVAVREMKSALCSAGYLSIEDVNDVFDHNTQASVELFQADEGLSETGIFDDETRKALNGRLMQKG